MEIKICLNYSTVHGASSRYYHLKMSMCGTQSVRERNGNNYRMIIVNSRCHVGVLFLTQHIRSDGKWPCPEFHLSQQTSHLLFLHYDKDVKTSKPSAHKTVLQMPSRKGRPREGKIWLRRLRHSPLGRAICRNHLLAWPFRKIFKSCNSTGSCVILNLTNLRVSETRASFHNPNVPVNSIHLGKLIRVKLLSQNKVGGHF